VDSEQGEHRPRGAPPAGDGLPPELADALSTLSFDLVADGRDPLRARRDRMARLIRGVHARLEHPDAPLLVVVAGGSGAGKSTTVNTLAGRAVTTPGVLRPTTRVPTLVCRPDDRDWFTDDRLLPDLVRVPAEAADGARADDSGLALRIATSDRLPAGVALLDTPDIDSVELRNHEVADQAIDAADAWIWLATVRTYADQVGMDYLLLARLRQALTAVVITQARPAERAEVEPDVARLLAEAGIRPDLTVFVPYAEVADGQLPPSAVAELRSWLDRLAGSADERRTVREQALDGLRAAAPDELRPLLAATEAEARAARELEALVARRFAAVGEELDDDLDAGLPLRTEILDRWQQLVGGGEALLKVQTAAGRLRDLVRSRLGVPSTRSADEVRVEIATELTRSVTRLVGQAHRAVRRDLEGRPDGRALLERHPELRDEPADPRAEVRRMVADWEDHVATLVAEVGTPAKARAQRWSTGLNAVATAAILVLFTLSGGLTGGEVGIAAGAAAANQWLLTRLLGEQNLRRLLADIRADLFTRVDELAAQHRRRYEDAIAEAEPPASAVASLRTAVGADR
jgi:hypothetical protein